MFKLAVSHIDNSGVLNDALEKFRQAAASWQDMMMSAASDLFWTLATVSLVWTLGQLALRRAEIGEFFGEVLRFSLFTGFWSWMLTHAPEHARLIMKSMQQLGAQTNGNAQLPSDIVDMGFHVLDVSLQQMSLLSPVDAVVNAVLGVGVAVIMALIAANLVVVLVAVWFVAYVGLFVVGFGAAKWTNDMALNYYRTVLSLALQALSLILLTGVGQGLIRSYYDRLDADVSLHEQTVVLVVGLILLSLVNRVPPLIGGLVSGASPQHALGHGPGPATALSTASTAWGAGRLASESASAVGRAALVTGAGVAAATAASLMSAFRGARATDIDLGASGEGDPKSSKGGAVFAMPSAPITMSSESRAVDDHPSTPQLAPNRADRPASPVEAINLPDDASPSIQPDPQEGPVNETRVGGESQRAGEMIDPIAFNPLSAPGVGPSSSAPAMGPEGSLQVPSSDPIAVSPPSRTGDMTSAVPQASGPTDGRVDTNPVGAVAASQTSTHTALVQGAATAATAPSQPALPRAAAAPASSAVPASPAPLVAPPPAGLLTSKGAAQGPGQTLLQASAGAVVPNAGMTQVPLAAASTKRPLPGAPPSPMLSTAARVDSGASLKTQAVDIEAEVSAFRDRD
jgi:type IV secretion system protein TrbL